MGTSAGRFFMFRTDQKTDDTRLRPSPCAGLTLDWKHECSLTMNGWLPSLVTWNTRFSDLTLPKWSSHRSRTQETHTRNEPRTRHELHGLPALPTRLIE